LQSSALLLYCSNNYTFLQHDQLQEEICFQIYGKENFLQQPFSSKFNFERIAVSSVGKAAD
jgi:hypothetical protein